MPFSDSVYGIVKGIPAGKVMSYSQVAERAGSPGAARAVGMLMAENGLPGSGPGRIPCHRVVKADGSVGGYSAEGGPVRKRLMLEREGVRFSSGQMNVITNASTELSKIGPPAEREYAVEPVGVETIRPSLRKSRSCDLSIETVK